MLLTSSDRESLVCASQMSATSELWSASQAAACYAGASYQALHFAADRKVKWVVNSAQHLAADKDAALTASLYTCMQTQLSSVSGKGGV